MTSQGRYNDVFCETLSDRARRVRTLSTTQDPCSFNLLLVHLMTNEVNLVAKAMV